MSNQPTWKFAYNKFNLFFFADQENNSNISKNGSLQTNKPNTKVAMRPLSEVRVATPFYKPFQAQCVSESLVKSSNDQSGDETTLPFDPNSPNTTYKANGSQPFLEKNNYKLERQAPDAVDTSTKSAPGEQVLAHALADFPADSGTGSDASNASASLVKNTEQTPEGARAVDEDKTNATRLANVKELVHLQESLNPDHSSGRQVASNQSKSANCQNQGKLEALGGYVQPFARSAEAAKLQTPDSKPGTVNSPVIDAASQLLTNEIEKTLNESENSAFVLSGEDSESEMSNRNSPMAAPRRSHSAVSGSLRSCQDRSYEVRGPTARESRVSSSSVTSKSSLSSLDFAEEDGVAVSPTATVFVRRTNGYDVGVFDGNRPGGNASTVERESRKRLPKPASRSSKNSASSAHQEKERPDKVIKGILRNRACDSRPVEERVRAKSADRRLGWNDGPNKASGNRPEKAEGRGEARLENGHGTWPGRKHKPKGQQDQEEADELLRKFREVSDAHRNKFRDIYADTRRRVQEAMFNLRVSMAKNGYSDRRFQPQYDERYFVRQGKT